MKNQSQNRSQFEKFEREILRWGTIASMCGNAPKDEYGNTVVSIASVDCIGEFYVFMN